MATRTALFFLTALTVFAAVDPTVPYEVHRLTTPYPSRVDANIPADQVSFGASDIACDAAGNLYFADRHGIRRADSSGQISRVTAWTRKGNISDPPQPSADGTPAIIASNWPRAIAATTDGTLYLAQEGNWLTPPLIRRIGPDGIIHTLTSGLDARSLALSPEGILYANTQTAIYRIEPSGDSTLVAGTGECGYGEPGGPASETNICAQDIAAGPGGTVYFAEHSRISRITPDGTIETFAGSIGYGFSGDGGPAADAKFKWISSIATGPDGSLFIADQLNERVRRVDMNGIVDTYVGGGGQLADGVPATETYLAEPDNVAVTPSGTLYIASGLHVRVVDTAGIITSPIGCGGCYGDGQHITFAEFGLLAGIAKDAAGNLYVGDSATQRVRKISPEGIVSRYAGTGQSGYSGDDGPAVNARLDSPMGVTADIAGNLYVADRNNHRIRRIALDGRISTFAGTGEYGYTGDGGPATQARLAHPEGVSFDPDGNLYIADFGNHAIRKVTPDGVITTIAGNGTPGFSGDAGPATKAQLQLPRHVAFDSGGNIYIADFANHRIRRIARDGVISTFAGIGPSNDYINLGDGGPATEAIFRGPTYLAFDDEGQLVLSDIGHSLIRVIDNDGIIRSLLIDGKNYLQVALFAFHLESGGALTGAGRGGVLSVQPKSAPPPEYRPFILWTGVTNAGSYIPGALAPGELVSIFGNNLATGPGSTTVTIGGLEAPVTYDSIGQINAVVPFGVERMESATLQVERLGELSNVVTQPVLPVVPGLITNSWPDEDYAAALNQDYSVNSSSNPAKPGEIVMLWATGFGQTDPPSVDGAINEAPLPQLRYPATATLDGVPLAVHYAGPAPGLIAGAIQVNVQLPAELPPSRAIILRVAGVPTQPGVYIYAE